MNSHLELPASALPAAGRVESFRFLSRLLGASFVVFIVALIWTPWQQSVRATGRVIAYAPLDRQQTIEAPIEGRVARWYVQEGDRVQVGDPIAELADNDPDILSRLEQERVAARAQVDATQVSIALTQARVESLQSARDSAIANARLRVQMGNDRRQAAERAVHADEASLHTASLNLTRSQELASKGLTSQRELELAQLTHQTALTKLDQSKASLRAAVAEVSALEAEQARIAASARADVENTQASLEKLRAEKAKAEQELAKVEVRLARQQRMEVTAPRAGTILRLLAAEGTEMVKPGDALVSLVPSVTAGAVELYLDGNDAPLVEAGRAVRLQFEGWPAVQFMGWPSVAVGTFGGTVAFVDAHDDGQGRFRVVVMPDAAQDWPESRYLRQGVRANGWVLLNRVSLGFELWRQFNGFPPALAKAQQSSTPSKGLEKR